MGKTYYLRPQTEQYKYIGIDVHLHRFTSACLDDNLQIHFVEDLSLNELLDRIELVSPRIIAVDSRLGLNTGLMDDEQYRRKLGIKTNKHHSKRVSEYELTRRGICLYSSPSSMDDISGWKNWMGTGLQLFERIKQMGYIHVNASTDFKKGVVEVLPHACFTTLAGKLLRSKTSDIGLHERLQLLENAGVSAMDKYLTGSKHFISDKLDAVIAAYTAYVVNKG